MKNDKNYTLELVFAVLTILVLSTAVIILGIMKFRCLQTEVAQPPMVHLQVDTVWVHDTLVRTSPALVQEVVREVPAQVDTAAILSAYHARRIYADTLHLRDVATIYLTDTLEQNMISGRGVTCDLMTLEPTIIYDPPSAVAVSRKKKPSSARLALSAGVQLGREQSAVAAGLRIRRAEILGVYDLRLHAPSITLKYDILQWQ